MLRSRNRQSQKAPSSLDVSVFNAVIEWGDAGARLALARQLAAFMVARETPPEDREAVTAPVLRLLMDKEKEIRATLAEGLRAAKDLHPDIVFSIVADDDDIALPFLALSPALAGARQMAIFEAGDMARRKALAGRCDLEGKTVSAMALKGEMPVVEILLDNAAVTPSDDDLKRIYVRFRDESRVMKRLMSRADLPLEIRIAHVRATSEKMRQRMRAGTWIAPGDMRGLVVKAEESALMHILAQAKTSEELMSALAFMSRKEILTPSVILRAGCHGHVQVLEHAMAFLSGMSPKRAHGMAHGRNPLALRALHGKSGLPQGCFLLVRAIFDTARDMDYRNFSSEPIAPEAFGRALMSRLVSSYGRVPMLEKTRLVEVLARFCDDKTRALAERFTSGLLMAA